LKELRGLKSNWVKWNPVPGIIAAATARRIIKKAQGKRRIKGGEKRHEGGVLKKTLRRRGISYQRGRKNQRLSEEKNDPGIDPRKGKKKRTSGLSSQVGEPSRGGGDVNG